METPINIDVLPLDLLTGHLEHIAKQRSCRRSRWQTWLSLPNFEQSIYAIQEECYKPRVQNHVALLRSRESMLEKK